MNPFDYPKILLACFPRLHFAGIAALLFLIQCSPALRQPTHEKEIPELLLGHFTDDYGNHYSISRHEWVQHPGMRFKILEYHADGPFIIAQNHAANTQDAGLFTRIDITWFQNMLPWQWGFCLTEYKASSADAARAAPAALRATPKTGCGGYPFSRMKRNELP